MEGIYTMNKVAGTESAREPRQLTDLRPIRHRKHKDGASDPFVNLTALPGQQEDPDCRCAIPRFLSDEAAGESAERAE